MSELWDLHKNKSYGYTDGTDPLQNYKVGSDFGPPWEYSFKKVLEKIARMEVKLRAIKNGTEVKLEDLWEDARDISLQTIITYILYEERK